MRHPRHPAGKPYSNILPGVVAAFLGMTVVVACDRPAPRAVNGGGAERQTLAQAPAAPVAAPAPQSEPAPRAPVPPSEAITDTMITARIKEAMVTDPGMAGADVSVNTDRGVVSLAGTVKTHEQTGLASAHAQRQDGVVRVDSHLSPKPQ